MLNISHHHSPGHACGLPLDGLGSLGSLGITPAYLLSSMQRFQKVSCADPRPCSDPDCDPYLSFLRSKWYCWGNQLPAPDLREWKTDAVFSDHFLHGMNPLLVRRVRHLAELRPALRGLWSSGAAALLAQRRLYLADYSALEALRPRPGSVLYAPQVLPTPPASGPPRRQPHRGARAARHPSPHPPARCCLPPPHLPLGGPA